MLNSINYSNYRYNNNVIFLGNKTQKPQLRSSSVPDPVVENLFADYIDNSPNFNETMQSMLRGLDEKSQNMLKMIIARIYAAAKLGIDFLTPAECEHSKATKKLEDVSAKLDGKTIEVDGMKFVSNGFGKSQVIAKLGIEEHFKQKDFDYIKDTCVIDAGAGFGETAVILSKYNNNGPVLAFEPTEQTRHYAKQNVKLNNLEDRVKVLKYGLSDSDKTVKFTIDPQHLTSNTINPANNVGAMNNFNYSKETEIDVRSLDSIKQANPNIGRIGLIKVDIEGEESKFIDGAAKTLKEDKPICLLSIYHSPRDFFNLKTKMEELGYKRFEIVKPDSKNITTEMMLFCYPY